LNEWDKIRTSCGADKCRKAASRASLAERKRQARTDARTRVLAYGEMQLDQEQQRVMMEMCDALMASSVEEGHEVVEQVVQIIEAKRCKHDRIEVLERNAAVWKRKAEASERQLQERITELEAELELFNSLEATIHGIATRQQQIQADPEEQLAPTPTSAASNDQRDPDAGEVDENEGSNMEQDGENEEEHIMSHTPIQAECVTGIRSHRHGSP